MKEAFKTAGLAVLIIIAIVAIGYFILLKVGSKGDLNSTRIEPSTEPPLEGIKQTP